MECILPVVTCICGRLADGLGNSLQSEAEGGVSFLVGLGGRALWDRICEWWRDKVARVPPQTANLVGAEETLNAIRGHLSSDQVDVVGIVGMGGVGKTTLLKEINNGFYARGPGKFDVVIFATVSREWNVPMLQEQIGGQLGISLPTGGDAQQNQPILYKFLSSKRFLLLLDDVWGRLDLLHIGVPLPGKENGCKIALTTRSVEVFGSFLGTWCRRRERAQTVKVSPLDEAKSWELFSGMVDAEVDLDDPSIRPDAERLVQKCGGLPLALVTVGRAMAAATLPAFWRKAVAQLEQSAYQLEGMDDVKSCLMFSIDRLEEGTLLPCFLYCSLFPEDHNIPEEQLIEYWIGEGFLDAGGGTADVHRARDEGVIAIEKLKQLFLLETGSGSRSRRGEHRCVKMHDMLREVALVIGTAGSNRFLVGSVDDEFEPHHFPRDIRRFQEIRADEWEAATRVSLMSCAVSEGSLPEMPSCPRVSTLLMPDAIVPRQLSDGFFTLMSSLIVLDLSRASDYIGIPLEGFPTSICLLRELRYLNLSGVQVRSLPEELGNLAKLRHLDLSEGLFLARVPRQAVAGLSNLQVLNMWQSGYRWNGGGEGDDVEGRQLCLSDLCGWEQLQDISLNLWYLDCLPDELLTRQRSPLSRTVTRLALEEIMGLTTHTLRLALRNLESLRELIIGGCQWLMGELILDAGGHSPVLPQLELLELHELLLSAIVIDEEEWGATSRRRGGAARPLQKLRSLKVYECPALKDLGWVAQLPNVERIVVHLCFQMEGLFGPADDDDDGGHAGTAAAAVGGGRATEILPKLTHLELDTLPELRSICGHRQRLRSLEYLDVYACPLMRTLPLAGADSNIRWIRCEQEWWEQLEWRRDQRDALRRADLAVTFV